MREMLGVVGLVLIGFLCGSFPFSLWIVRLVKGIDLREVGSGNIGATNSLRAAGWSWGPLALLADAAKGWVAAGVLPPLFGLGGVATGAPWPFLGGLAAVAGHIFSPLVGFKGGKGVATTLGVFIALAPLSALLGMGAFLLVLAIARFVSLASLVMTVTFPVAANWLGPPEPLRRITVLGGVVVALLVALRHRSNWKRILRGEEPRFGVRSGADGG